MIHYQWYCATGIIPFLNHKEKQMADTLDSEKNILANLRKYLGMDAQAFMAEWRTLDSKDKEELKEMMRKQLANMEG